MPATMYGISEIARAIGEDRRKVSVWKHRGKMPAPSCELSVGPVWLVATIEPWIKKCLSARQAKELETSPTP